MASAGGNLGEALEFSLVLLKDDCNTQQYAECVSTLLKIFRNILKNPEDAKYKEIKTNNKVFAEKIWRFQAAQQFLIAAGWSEIQDRVILLDDQFLTITVQTLEQINSQFEVEKPANPPTNSFKSEKDVLINETRRKQMEQMKKEKEERKRIADQIQADRRETKSRPTKDSVARPRQFGANINRFEDIGVDLNKGGG